MGDHSTHPAVRPHPVADLDKLPSAGHYVYRLYAGHPLYDPVADEDCETFAHRYPNEDPMTLVYVGVTSNLRQRMGSHSRKWWWPRLVSVEFFEYPTRAEANIDERYFIAADRPVLNIQDQFQIRLPVPPVKEYQYAPGEVPF